MSLGILAMYLAGALTPKGWAQGLWETVKAGADSASPSHSPYPQKPERVEET